MSRLAMKLSVREEWLLCRIGVGQHAVNPFALPVNDSASRLQTPKSHWATRYVLTDAWGGTSGATGSPNEETLNFYTNNASGK